MNEQRLEEPMEERTRTRLDRSLVWQQQNGRRWVGLFLLVVGGLFLARESGVAFPRWFFSWPMLLIGFGILSGIRHQFRGFGWLFPILIGSFFLIDHLSPELRLRPYIWPVVLIALGLVFVFKPKKPNWNNEEPRNYSPEGEGGTRSPAASFPGNKGQRQQSLDDSHDMIDATAIFGGVKKNVLSKHFRGGDITTFMGGAEINLTQADCHGRVVIDCFNMFGGTKLIVPPDWDVQSGVVTIFGGIEDKRLPSNVVNPGKVLYLDGTCIFGGVEIKSF